MNVPIITTHLEGCIQLSVPSRDEGNNIIGVVLNECAYELCHYGNQ